jgi:hypothetical protein
MAHKTWCCSSQRASAACLNPIEKPLAPNRVTGNRCFQSRRLISLNFSFPFSPPGTKASYAKDENKHPLDAESHPRPRLALLKSYASRPRQ